MERRVLYYPNIEPRNGPWLRQALLYWDCVASIFPNEYQSDSTRLTRPYVKMLIDKGALKPYYPSNLMDSQDSVEGLCEEFVRKLDDPHFQKLLKRSGKVSGDLPPVQMFASKVGYAARHALDQRGLIRRDSGEDEFETFSVQRHAADLYMAILAKCLAEEDAENFTVIGTDFTGIPPN